MEKMTIDDEISRARAQGLRHYHEQKASCVEGNDIIVAKYRRAGCRTAGGVPRALGAAASDAGDSAHFKQFSRAHRRPQLVRVPVERLAAGPASFCASTHGVTLQQNFRVADDAVRWV